MRLVHTSDWHLGHTLRGEVARDGEHRAFLDWLLARLDGADVLVITGDVFDSATPPASAERMWFEFLAVASPIVDIVVIAGNHDSPARLGAASSVLRELGVHVVGSMSDDVIVPVTGAVVAAVPFLRPVDLPDAPDPLAAVYADVIERARAQRGADQALIVTGHLYVAGADTQFLSERRVAVGGQEAAPLRLFPDDISYVALGHIHRAQRVGRETIRYAGAPLPLSLDEAGYKNSIAIVDFDGARVVKIETIPVPRTVEIVRVAGALDEVLAAIARFPALGAGERPYLEVVVSLGKPEPKLRARIEQALDGKHPRLVRLGVEGTGDGAALGDAIAQRRLAELDPREVFARLWARDHAEPAAPPVLAAFDRLLAEVQGDREDVS
ncbi:MAG TPA: exonuclease SbcCD subunit D C-terminal domain-containing protein [Kofleriaceae bacterium]|jgi:exonuclease SbcD